MQVTDAHAHVFSDDEEHYPVLESAHPRPTGIGTVPHLRKDMATAGVQRCP